MNVINFSGGKDSTAMLLRMKELGIKVDRVVFADTKLEFSEVYDFVNHISEVISQKIDVAKSDKCFDDLFYTEIGRGKLKGQIRGFPFVICPCWIQRDLKVAPMRKLQNKDDVCFLGYNADEKDRKQKHGIFRYPLIEWNWHGRDCLCYLKGKGLMPPYYRLFKRGGCWLCPKQSMLSLKLLYLYYPNLWEKLKNYERDSPHGFKPNFSLSKFEKSISSCPLERFYNNV